MASSEIVFGILNETGTMAEPTLARKLRDITLAWSRYQYRGLVLEGESVDEVLSRAAHTGSRYCFILSAGCVVVETWSESDPGGRSLLDALEEWVEGHDFLVAGRIVTREDKWFGLDSPYSLFDLKHWDEVASTELSPGPRESLNRPIVHRPNGRIVRLDPSRHTDSAEPSLWGWPWIAHSLAAGLPVWDISHEIGTKILDVRPTTKAQAEALLSLLGEGIGSISADGPIPCLSGDQVRFLSTVAYHHAGSQRCIFPWNIESYDDVTGTMSTDDGPLRSVYSVAAGFKPNWILQTGGFSPTTRVVYFDYSRRGLEAKRTLVEEWNGRDFPRMLRRLFEMFPSRDTAYCLWDRLTPESISNGQLENGWRRELDRWGGEDVFASHWDRYRNLPHTYVACDIVRKPAPLFEHIVAEPGAVAWWSNAFFTVFANWHMTAEERRERYERFIEGLAVAAPDMAIFGSDYNNSNVNGLSAGEYWAQYRSGSFNPLTPCSLHRVEIRM